MREIKIEAKLLENWNLRIAVLMAILSPAIAATGAYYNLKADYVASVQAAEARIEQKYVTRDSYSDLKESVKEVKDDVKEIKAMLMKDQRRGR